MSPITFWSLVLVAWGVLLLAFVAWLSRCPIERPEQDDEEQMEYLAAWSNARRERGE
jgi:hypothetical protein